MEKGLNLVITLTSYPKRIKSVHMVIESLFMQTVKANEILLYLSRLEFPEKEQNLPHELLRIVGKNGFKIIWVDDNLKSHKKYYYVLQDKRNAIVITVDDDVIYADTMVADLLKGYKKFPHAVSAGRARIILRDGKEIADYKEWDGCLEEYANQPRMDLCAIGVGGVLYPPACASDEWFSKERITALAENQDDLWLKYNEVKKRIPVVYVNKSKNDISIDRESESSLCGLNLYGGENNSCIQKLIEDAKTFAPEIYQQLFLKLQQKEDYIRQKKQYYFHKAEKVFENLKDKPIYLYGAGQRANKIVKILADCGLKHRIKKIIVSDKTNNPLDVDGIAVAQIDEIVSLQKAGVICGVSDAYANEVKKLLKQYDCELIYLDLDVIMRYYTA